MKKIIVIPFNVPWTWTTDYLNQTAYELARRGNVVVCYLSFEMKNLADTLSAGQRPVLIKRYSENIYVFKPLFFIPFRSSRFTKSEFANKLNQNINLIMLRFFTEILFLYKRCKRKIFWIFDPSLKFIYKSFGKNYFLLYDCVDFFTVGDNKAIRRAKINEKELCREADFVSANSTVLQKHLMEYRSDVKLVVQGFRSEGFDVKKEKYIDLHLKPPVIGFVGGINNRLDTSMLLPLIKNNPKWNFVLWGPIQKDMPTGSDRLKEITKIFKLPNVTHGASTDKGEIPGLISQFDIGIIPYDKTQDFNKYCYPMKLFEFFYLGKPVISTTIEELKRFPEFVRIAEGYRDWEKAIKDIVSAGWSTNLKNREKKLAIENSWKNKVGAILSQI